MWSKALYDLKNFLKNKFPECNVEIGKDKPSGSDDYPFIYVLPTEMSYESQELRLGVVLYVGAVVKEENRHEEGTLELLNLLTELQLTLINEPLPTKEFEVLPESYALKDFSKKPPYFEGEVHVILRKPFLTTPTQNPA